MIHPSTNYPNNRPCCCDIIPLNRPHEEQLVNYDYQAHHSAGCSNISSDLVCLTRLVSSKPTNLRISRTNQGCELMGHPAYTKH